LTRRSTASIVASPVLVGAVTVLVAIVAVLLAYSANQGLPFVPTYKVSAELPGGENLVRGNDVRVGGYRVGLVKEIRSKVDEQTGKAIAVADLELDKAVEPLPSDTKVLVRPRSPLGLKYIELTLGNSKAELRPGAAIPLAQATEPVELDQFFGIFNAEFRDNQRTALEGYGSALAGRGQSINIAIQEFVPLLRNAEPVFEVLSDPNTALGRFVRQSRGFVGQIAPVASTYSQLFTNMATTFEALGRSPAALAQTIERAAPALQAGIRSLPVQRPFMADSAILFERLKPVAEELRASLPTITNALVVGQPVLLRAPALYERTRGLMRAIRGLMANPNTLLALKDLTSTLAIAAPLVEFIAPYQTVCNFWNYFWTGLGEHISEPVRGGTIQRVQLKLDDRSQDNRVGDTNAERPVDIPASSDPLTARGNTGQLQTLHSQYYGAAIDAKGRADCENGQRGYLNRKITGSRYPVTDDPNNLGGNHIVMDPNTPGLQGPTYKGLKNLKDVP